MCRRMLSVWILILAMLFAAVPVAGFGEEASGTVTVDQVDALDAFFGSVYLAYDTIPEEERMEEIFISEKRGMISYRGKIYNCWPQVLEITPVSGDADLLSALSFRKGDYSSDGDLFLDYKELHHPGEVTLHIHVEFGAENEEKTYVHDGDYTLRVIGWEGPVMEFLEDVNEISVRRQDIPADEFFPRVARYAEYAQGLGIQTIFLNGSGTSDFNSSFLEEGDSQVRIRFCFGPVEYQKEFTVHLYPFVLKAPDWIVPGQTVNCLVLREGMWNRTSLAPEFVLAAEGAGADITEDGDLTVPETARIGDTVTLKATRAADTFSLEKTITVSDYPWNALPYRLQPMGDFSVPVPDDDSFRTEIGQDEDGNLKVTSLSGENKFEYRLAKLQGRNVPRDRKQAAAILQQYARRSPEARMFNLNGIPGMVNVRLRFDQSESFELEDGTRGYAEFGNIREWKGSIMLLQGDIELRAEISWEPGENEVLTEFTPEMLLKILSRMTVNGVPAVIQDSDPTPEIAAGTDRIAVEEGGSRQFTVSEASLARTEQWGKIVWSVETADGRQAKGIKISEDGLLTVGKGAAKNTGGQVLVCARYTDSSETASLPVFIVPILKGVAISSSMEGDFGYIGSREFVTARADPFGAILGEGTWSVDKPEMLEIVENEHADSSYSSFEFIPLRTGKVTVTFVTASGKKASKKYTFSDKPVTDVKIGVKSGKAVAGGTMQFVAELTPEKPDYPKVYWTVDVDNSVATIDSGRGVLKIKKGVSSGTVITVTLYAHGAPDTLSDTLEITVE